MSEALAISEALIDEIFQATAMVIGTPMYNFEMPTQIKAYVDQIVCVGRTFSFNDGEAAQPYQMIVPSKPMVIITSTGAGNAFLKPQVPSRCGSGLASIW